MLENSFATSYAKVKYNDGDEKLFILETIVLELKKLAVSIKYIAEIVRKTIMMDLII